MSYTKSSPSKSDSDSEPFSLRLDVYEDDEEETQADEEDVDDDYTDLNVTEESKEDDTLEDSTLIEDEDFTVEFRNYATTSRKRKLDANESLRMKKKSKLSNVMPNVLLQIGEAIEKQLDAKASLSHLTVANVKTILKQVISNKQVLAMVRHTIDEEDQDEDEDDVPLPKLTRSKAKELLATLPQTAWPMSPIKRPSECQALIEQDLPEDSSDDEEYQPNEDDLNKDMELDLLSEPATPGLTSSTPDLRPPSNLDCGTQTVWPEDGSSKAPVENIGQRTRSKFSLSDTALETIEKAFIPPDITTDMYEPECGDDDWTEFLNNFTEPLRPSVNDTIEDDDDTDPEYNLLADEDKEPVDAEELRMDRGVKVSKRELNLLMSELLDIFNDEMPSEKPAAYQEPCVDSREEAETTFVEETPEEEVEEMVEEEAEENVELSGIEEDDVTVILEEPVKTETSFEEVLMLTPAQKKLLDQQMRKHVQLVAQHFLQTYRHPYLSELAMQCKEQLVTLRCLSKSQPNSAFGAANLDAALDLVHDWEFTMDPKSLEAVEIIESIQHEIDTSIRYMKSKRKYSCQFPVQMMQAISRSVAIVYPLLLPMIPFRCDGFYKMNLLLSECHLIAIGLEQFLPYLRQMKKVEPDSKSAKWSASKWELREAVTLINKYLVPGHNFFAIQRHVERQKQSRDLGSPVRYFFVNETAAGTDHFVVSFNPTVDLKYLIEQPKELLPDIWRNYVHLDSIVHEDGVEIYDSCGKRPLHPAGVPIEPPIELTNHFGMRPIRPAFHFVSVDKNL